MPGKAHLAATSENAAFLREIRPDVFDGRVMVADRCRPVGVKPTETKALRKNSIAWMGKIRCPWLVN